jgi:tetratricopeptide (TPR) repeat protein
MVKDTVKKEQLPDDFPARVVANLLETGRKERLYMHYDKARGHFQEALEVAPEDPEVLLELGRTYDMMDWPDVETLERAAAFLPNSVEVACELEIAYRQPGFEQDHKKAFRQSLKLCEQRLTDSPKDVRALKSKARLLFGADDYANAEKLLQIAVEEAPEDQEALYYLALSTGRQHRHEEAGKFYETVYQLNPKSVWAFGSLRNLSTYLAFRKGEGKQAVELMEKVWELKPVPNEADNLIYFYNATVQLQKALEVFETVKEHHHPSRVYATVGIACMKNGDLDRAEQAMKSAINSTDDGGLRAEVQMHLARILFALEKSNEAQKTLEDGLQLDLERRRSLAGEKASAFWMPWTKWLIETLESLEKKDTRMKLFLQMAREEFDQLTS